MRQRFKSYADLRANLPDAESFSATYQTWSDTNRDTIAATLSAASLTAKQFDTEEATMASLRSLSDGANGQMKALQVGHEIAAQQVAQMQKLRGLVSQQMTMMGTWLQTNQTDKDLAQARREQFFRATIPQTWRRQDHGAAMVRHLRRQRGRASDARECRLGSPCFFFVMVAPVHAQEGSLITSLQDEISGAARGWEQTVSNASRSLFWILASIEIGLAAIWLALQAPSLQEWFAELVRRIMFVGFFALVLERGPAFAKAVVDSLFQIGASGGDASPADIFNAGLVVAAKMAEKDPLWPVRRQCAGGVGGLRNDRGRHRLSRWCAAIFVSIMAEMYIGLLAGMIMLGLGGSSFTKDFAIRYLVYAFSVGMKLMALVMIARIGSEVLIGLANRPGDRRPVPDAARDRRNCRRRLRHCHLCTKHHSGRHPRRVGGQRHGGYPARQPGRLLCGRGRLPGGRERLGRHVGGEIGPGWRRIDGGRRHARLGGRCERREHGDRIGLEGQGDRGAGLACRIAAWTCQCQTRTGPVRGRQGIVDSAPTRTTDVNEEWGS